MGKNVKKYHLPFTIFFLVIYPLILQIEDMPTTVGIDCSYFNLESGEVSVWDFGGQLQYSATHEFFVTMGVCIY